MINMKKGIKVFLLSSIFCLPMNAMSVEAVANEHPAVVSDYTDRIDTDANIYGHVIDKATREHLPYITVFIKEYNISTMTDATGHYFLKNLPVGKAVLEVSCVGYCPVQKEVTLRKNSTLELNFELVEDRMALNEVVVTANRSATLRNMAPNIVNVLDSKLLEVTHSACLAQGLNFQPGVRVEDNCQNCGFSQVRINGLDGHYSQILIDSKPIFSALNGVYGLEQIPANMVDRVEVVRGGGSALYGASAIGGTINVLTKEPIRNSAAFSHDISAIGGFNSFDNNTMLNASIVTEDNNMGFYVYGQNHHRNGFDLDKDGYTELPLLDNKTVGMRSFFKINSHSKLVAEYHGMSEFRRGGNLLDCPAHEANIAEQVEHNINGGSLNYDWNSLDQKNWLDIFFSFQDTKRKSFYGGTGETNTEEAIAEARKAYGKTSGLTLVGGAQYVHNFDKLWFMPANLTVGLEYNRDNLKDIVLGYNTQTRQNVNIMSLYGQNEWTNKKFTFLLGARLDKHSLLDHPVFSPRVNFRFNPNHHFNLRASYSSGFRAPQIFDEDLHVKLVGGGRVVTRMADGLKEEKSHSVSLSSDMYWNFGEWQTNFLVEGFYTRLNDVFAYRKIKDEDENGNLVQERYNAYGANVYGANLEAKFAYNKLLQFQGGLTYQKSRYTKPVVWDEDAPSEQRVLRTPDFYGYFTAQTHPLKHFSAALTGTYTGSMLVGKGAIQEGPYQRVAEAVETPSFFTLDMKLTYDTKIYESVGMEISLGVKNMFNAFQKDFDKGWSRDSAYVYGPGMPRSFFFGVKFSY